jgi:hypothetical protein
MTDASQVLATIDVHAALAVAAARRALDADVARELAKISDGHGTRLRLDDPLAQKVAALTRTLVEAGFTVHDCATRERTGGVCLTPANRDDGVLITWTTHDAVAMDGDRYQEDRDLHEVMNCALADALRTCGWRVDAYGQASAHIVTGRVGDTESREQS